MKIMNPVATIAERAFDLASRPGDLTGKRVALLHNGKPGGRPILERLGERLHSDSDVADVRYWRKPHPSAAAVFLEELADSADLAVGALSD